MNKSPEIDSLAAALSKLQGEVVDAYKDQSGYNFDYADLSSVLKIARPLLAKYELALVQMPSTGTAGDCILETCIMHSSGQFISSQLKMEVPLAKNLSSAQSLGAVITYARRYSASAYLAITQSDSDAALIGDEADEHIAVTIDGATDRDQLAEMWKELSGPQKRRFQKKLDSKLTELKAPKKEIK